MTASSFSPAMLPERSSTTARSSGGRSPTTSPSPRSRSNRWTSSVPLRRSSTSNCGNTSSFTDPEVITQPRPPGTGASAFASTFASAFAGSLDASRLGSPLPVHPLVTSNANIVNTSETCEDGRGLDIAACNAVAVRWF
ncbi:hypothetical protein [Nannocystis pusilla]|uniref:hypothetical protein n=1 Tax=Nannocystis pusilla TaxID=889268 RepID=UPI003B7C200D